MTLVGECLLKSSLTGKALKNICSLSHNDEVIPTKYAYLFVPMGSKD